MDGLKLAFKGLNTTTLNTKTISSPSNYMSDFWLIDATYLRLKTVEVGYQLPDRWLPLKINNARIYLSGYNLLTWTNYSLYQQDPEVTSNTAGDAYQNQRVINMGVQMDCKRPVDYSLGITRPSYNLCKN